MRRLLWNGPRVNRRSLGIPRTAMTITRCLAVSRVLCAGVLLTACASPQSPADHERAVIAAALEASADSSGERAVHLLVRPTLEVPAILWYGAALDSVLPPASIGGLVALGIDSSLAEDFARVAQAEDSLPLPVPTRHKVSVNAVPIQGFSLDSILRNPELRSGAGFEALARAYPGARALYSVSHVGFAQRHSRALVYVHSECGYLCGGGSLLELRRVGARWHVAQRYDLWVS